MKKIAGLVCVVLALALLPVLSACGGKDMSSSPYVGKWTAKTASMSGFSLDIDSIFDGGWTIDLQKDGTVVMDVSGETNKGKWEQTDDGFSIEGEYVVTVKDSVGTMDYEGLIITFEKEG